MYTKTKELDRDIVNGVDADYLRALVGKIQEDEKYGQFRFRASNHWVDGARNQTSVQDFYAGGKEDSSRTEPLTVDADQPAFLGGTNTAPNPVEHLLHALTSCLTTTLVYHASVQGIDIQGVEVTAEGDLNARGIFGLSEDVNKGYERIRVNMRVKSNASVGALKELAMYSPVFEVVSKAVPVAFTLITS